MDNDSTPAKVRLSEGLGPGAEADELTRAITSAWQRHAQRMKYQWPSGCGGYAALQTPEIMAELGFREAVREVVDCMVARVSAAPVAIMDTRDALGLCAPTEDDFPALYALSGHRVRLLDEGPNK
jgi:hypothetical protein